MSVSLDHLMARAMSVVTKRFDATTTAMTCAQEALASNDYQTMRDDLIRGANELDAAAFALRQAAGFAQDASEERL